jgi:hypothetical protein
MPLQENKPGAFLDKHGNRKLIRNAFDRAADATVSAVPTFIRIYDLRTLIFHFENIARTIFHAVSTQITFIHIEYGRHNFTPFLMLFFVWLFPVRIPSLST